MYDMVTILGELRSEEFVEFDELMTEIAVTFSHFEKEVYKVVDVDDDRIDIYCMTDIANTYEKYTLEIPYNIEKDCYKLSRVFCTQVKL